MSKASENQGSKETRSETPITDGSPDMVSTGTQTSLVSLPLSEVLVDEKTIPVDNINFDAWLGIIDNMLMLDPKSTSHMGRLNEITNMMAVILNERDRARTKEQLSKAAVDDLGISSAAPIKMEMEEIREILGQNWRGESMHSRLEQIKEELDRAAKQKLALGDRFQQENDLRERYHETVMMRDYAAKEHLREQDEALERERILSQEAREQRELCLDLKTALETLKDSHQQETQKLEAKVSEGENKLADAEEESKASSAKVETYKMIYHKEIQLANKRIDQLQAKFEKGDQEKVIEQLLSEIASLTTANSEYVTSKARLYQDYNVATQLKNDFKSDARKAGQKAIRMAKQVDDLTAENIQQRLEIRNQNRLIKAYSTSLESTNTALRLNMEEMNAHRTENVNKQIIIHQQASTIERKDLTMHNLETHIETLEMEISHLQGVIAGEESEEDLEDFGDEESEPSAADEIVAGYNQDIQGEPF